MINKSDTNLNCSTNQKICSKKINKLEIKIYFLKERIKDQTLEIVLTILQSIQIQNSNSTD